MKVVINCGKSDILKGKQVVSLVKRFLINSFNAFNLHHQHPHAVCNCLKFVIHMRAGMENDIRKPSKCFKSLDFVC